MHVLSLLTIEANLWQMTKTEIKKIESKSKELYVVFHFESESSI